MTKLRSVGVGVVFLVGCAVGGASGRFVVPPAGAQQAEGITRWEYVCFSQLGAVAVRENANKLGAQGWEMVSAAGVGAPNVDGFMTWCFKRKL